MLLKLRIGLVSLTASALLALVFPGSLLATHTVDLVVTGADRTDGVVTVTGTINCTRGSFVGTWDVQVQGEQSNGNRFAVGSTPTGQCGSNTIEPWTIVLVGDPFHGGWVNLVVTGEVCVVNFDETHCTPAPMQELRIKPT